MKSFYYRYGPVETTKLWYQPIPKHLLDNWVKDFNQLDLEDYSIYLGGKYVIDPLNTNDIDICITGPIHNYNTLYHIMKTGYELAFDKYQFLIDIKHYDNLDFFKYPRTKGFKRYHIMTELAGLEQKIINGVEVFNTIRKTHIPNSEFIPKEFAVNIAIFPMEKQIKDGRIYDPIKLI